MLSPVTDSIHTTSSTGQAADSRCVCVCVCHCVCVRVCVCGVNGHPIYVHTGQYKWSD